MKIKNIKWFNKHLLLLFAILLVGLSLRIINYRMGLWYDEINTYLIAKQSFPFGILQSLMERDYHVPFYYFILHFWMNLFGNSDLTLRLLSLIFSCLSLPIAYLIGKEISEPKLGLVILSLFSVSSGLIYYSQEVRFYSMLVFFATLSALFLVRIKNNPSKLNYAGLIISNLLIIYTYTVGFIFVLIELMLFVGYLNSLKIKTKGFIQSSLIILILSIPLIPLLIYFVIKNSNILFRCFDYYNFQWDYLFNIIKSICGPSMPAYSLFWLKEPIFMYLLILLSTVIFLFFVFKAIFKNKFILMLFLVGLIPFLLELVFALTGEFALAYNKSILSVPFFIITAGCALLQFNNKKLFYILFFIYIFANLFYLIFNHNSVLYDNKGNSFVAIQQGLGKLNVEVNKQDRLIILPCGDIANKYEYKAYLEPVCFVDYNINKKENLEHIFEPDFVASLNRSNIYDKLKVFVNSKEPTSRFKSFIINDIGNKVPKGRYFLIVSAHTIKSEKYVYEKKHLTDAFLKKIIDDVLIILNHDNHFKLINSRNYCGWTFYIFQHV